MRFRCLLFVVGLTLFGFAFGCKGLLSSNPKDYLLAYQQNVLIVETKLLKNILEGEGLVGAKWFVADNPSEEFDADCMLVDNKTRGRCAITFSQLPKSEPYKIKIKIDAKAYSLEARAEKEENPNYQYKEEDLIDVESTTPELDVSKAKYFPIALLGVSLHEEGNQYTFSISGATPEPVSGATLMHGIDMDGLRQTIEPLTQCGITPDGAKFACNFSFVSRVIPVGSRWVRVDSKDGRVITPLLRMKGCVQTKMVAGEEGAGICLALSPAIIGIAEHDVVAALEIAETGIVFKPRPVDEGEPSEEAAAEEAPTEEVPAEEAPAEVVGVEEGVGEEEAPVALGEPTAPTEVGEAVAGEKGGCSLGGAAAANPATFLLLSMALLPIAIRRKRS